MSNFNENFLTKNLQITKAVFKTNLQGCKSSQIVGRKINNGCLLVKSQKGKKLNPNVMVLQGKKGTDPIRKYIRKKSPGRSLSLNRILGEKEFKTEVPSHVSPPRFLKKNKEKINGSSQILDDLPKLEISEAVCPSTPRILRQKKIKTNKSIQVLDDTCKIEKLSPYNQTKLLTRTVRKKEEKFEVFKDPEEKQKTSAKKLKLKNWPEKTAKKKTKLKKIVFAKGPGDSKAWKDIKNSETDENCVKTDRDQIKKKKKKGVELFSALKTKPKKINKSQDASKHKSYDLLSFDLSRKLKKPKKLISPTKEDSQKLQNLNCSEKFQIKKFKAKKKKNTRSIWLDDENKSPVSRKNQSSDEKRELSIENKLLKDQLYKLKQRVFKTKKELMFKDYSLNLMKNIDKVVKIQRWFRKRIKNRIQESGSLDNNQIEKWINLQRPGLNNRTSSDLVRSFDCKIFNSVDEGVKDYSKDEEIRGDKDCDEDEVESIPKKVEKVPSLRLNFILQAKHMSEDFNPSSVFGHILKDSLNSESSDSDVRLEYNSSSSKIKQVSDLDIHNESFSSLEDQPEPNPTLLTATDNSQLKTEENLQNPLNTSSNSSENLKNSPETQPDLQNPLKPSESPLSDTNTQQKEKPLASLTQIPIFPPSENSFKSNESLQNSAEILSGDLSYQDSDLESSQYSDPDNSLKRILKNKSDDQPEIIDRPEHNMISDLDSSEDNMNTNNFILHTDTSISEEKLEALSVSPKPYLSEFDQDIIKLIDIELDHFLKNVKFSLGQKDVDPGLQFIELYINKLSEQLEQNEDEMLELINTPSYQDPYNKLEILQTVPLGKLNKFPALELILPQYLSSELKKEFNSLEIPNKQIYLQMIFDCVNEALNHIRPFALDGLPDPWSPVSSTLYGEGQIKVVFDKIKKLIHNWESVKCGMMVDKVEDPSVQKVKKIQEERLNVILAQNAKDFESKWLWYEDEETQVKIDVSDLAFEFLIEETFCFLKIV